MPDQPRSGGDPSDELGRCATCGSALPADEWCPIAAGTDADGNLVLRSFCDETCKRRWTAR